MLIRITRGSSSLDWYLEEGIKKGRDYTRAELDQRVNLAGDINAFGAAVAFTNRTKKWNKHYYHVSLSFAIDNNDLSDETLRAITRDLMGYHYCDYDIDNLIYIAEAHRPILQSEVNKTTGEVNQRLLHIHIGTSMLDINTGNQVRMIPFNFEADKAFQSRMAEKYGLVDPADRKREKQITKKDIIDRWKNNPTRKQTKVAELRHLFAELVDDVENIDEAIELLKGLDVVESVELKEQKSGNKYLQVKTTVGSKDINLRGKGFESLEKLYYSADELAERETKGKYHSSELKENKDIDHKKWWLEQQAKRGHGKKIDYPAIQNGYEKEFSKLSKEERLYYVLYKNNIKEELINGFSIWEKANTRYLFNNTLGIKIYDRPDQISAQIPEDADKRSQSIALMLEMAKAKGWDINNLTIDGSNSFKKEVAKQTEQIRISTEAVALNVAIPEPEPAPEPQEIASDAVIQEAHDNEQRKTELLSKEQISAIKVDLDANAVINYAVENISLIRGHFSVIDNKIADDRTRAKPKNVIDFFTKTCNIPLTDALPILNGLLAVQEKTQQPEKTHDNTSDIRYFRHAPPKRHPGPPRPVTHNRLQWLSERNLARDNKVSNGTTGILPTHVLADRRALGGVRRGDTGSAERRINESALPQHEQIQMNISICGNSAINALTDWKNIEVKTFADLEKTIKSHSYGGFGQLKDGYRLGENVVALSNLAIFDIDNDPGTEQLSIEQAQELLKETTYLIVTSRSHQKDKDGKPAVDRYRVIVPLTDALNAEKDLYRLQMVKLADGLGLTTFADPKALKDIARYYYPSPAEAHVFVNNTHQALNSSGAKQFGIDELARLENVKAEAREAIRNRIIPSQHNELANAGDFPKIPNIDAMNKLPLDELYAVYTGHELETDGSYLMGHGFTPGTSQSRNSLTIFRDAQGGDWIWHDFKTGESGNVLTFMRKAAGLNAFEAAQELQKKYGVALLVDNPVYYGKMVNDALYVARNDKDLETEIKRIAKVRYAKVVRDGSGIKIADKKFSFEQLGINKGEMIEKLKTNREQAEIDKARLKAIFEKEQEIEIDDDLDFDR